MVKYLQLQATERAVVVAVKELICVLVGGIHTIWLCVMVVLKWSFIEKDWYFGLVAVVVVVVVET